jgi:hypothetical protein
MSSDAGSTVVRTASEPVTTTETNAPGADPSHISDSHEASLFATYEADQKHPYVADYFEVPDMWDKEETLARDLKEIEGYLRSRVENQKLANSTKAAKEFLKELERKAGLTRYESAPQRIEKILAYIDFKKVVDS